MGIEITSDYEPMRLVRLSNPFHRYVGTIAKEAISVPAMMSVPERRFLHGLARDYYEGQGVIVDAGIFLGASTVCFGLGVKENPRSQEIIPQWIKPVISFERGIVSDIMPAFFERNKVDVALKPGDSFVDVVRENINDVADVVDLRIGDIMQTGAVDRPIEILFLDVLKLPEINKFVVENYFPLLIPGRSIVIQQDYFYDRLPYIKTHQEFFADHFDFLGEIGSTAVFRCVKTITKDDIDFNKMLESANQIKCASIALQRSADPSRRFLMALSKARLLKQVQGARAAQEYLRAVRSDYSEQLEQPRIARLRDAYAAVERFVATKNGSDTGDLLLELDHGH